MTSFDAGTTFDGSAQASGYAAEHDTQNRPTLRIDPRYRVTPIDDRYPDADLPPTGPGA